MDDNGNEAGKKRIALSLPDDTLPQACNILSSYLQTENLPFNKFNPSTSSKAREFFNDSILQPLSEARESLLQTPIAAE